MRNSGALVAGVMVLAEPLLGLLRSETVTGEVISLTCYMRDKSNVGSKGLVCAIATVKWEGQPVGLLAPGGKVYVLAGEVVANNNARIAPHLSHTVTITGDVTDHDGVTTLTARAADVKLVK
jgi:hypothetical protein